MKKIFKNSVLVFMLWVFIFPIVVKSIHVHEHFFTSNAKTQKHFLEIREKCFICNYEFSVFSTNSNINQQQKGETLDFYSNNYVSPFVLKQYFLTFLSRAPPINN